MIRNKPAEVLTKYNLWANKRIVHWLQSNDQDLISKTCQSSFSSILKTIHHIWDGELYFLSTLKKSSNKKIWDGSIDGVFEGFISKSKEFVEYVEAQDIDLSGKSGFITLKTPDIVFTQYELIQHCMNHSTFHRGQIITIGHQLGLNKAPSTDMIYYFIKRERLNNKR